MRGMLILWDVLWMWGCSPHYVLNWAHFFFILKSSQPLRALQACEKARKAQTVVGTQSNISIN